MEYFTSRCMGRQDELGMHSDGGCRIVTTARAVCNVLERRSCNELHAIRTRQLVFLFAASLGNMCRQYSPMLLQTFPTQDLTQFIAGATLHQRLVGNKKFHQRKWRRTPVRHLQEQMRPLRLEKKMIKPECHQKHLRKRYRWLMLGGKS